MITTPAFGSVRHSEGVVCPRNPSSAEKSREIPRFARNDGNCLTSDKNVGAPTFQVMLEVAVGGADRAGEIPRYARNDGFVRKAKGFEWRDDKNVGAPTFKVILEVRLEITNSQNGTASEVIA